MQIIEDDEDQYSSSEGSTVDCPLGGETRASEHSELEESMDPYACFPDGKDCSHCHHRNQYTFCVKMGISPHPFCVFQAACKGSSAAR